MQDIFDALGRGFKSLLTPKMLVLTLWPMLLALLFWGGLAWLFWDQWAGALTEIARQNGIEDRLLQWGFVWLAHWLVVALLMSMLLPAVYVSSLVFTAVFAMPVMLKFVVARDYPDLEMKHGGTLLGSVWNSLLVVVIYLLLWIITLPFWLVPFGVIVMPVLLSAYLNQRLFPYDALMDHASRDEFRQIQQRSRGGLFGLGAILGFAHYIPILNFFTPIYIGLAYIHFCLAQLQRLRAEQR
jgi:CysZ protein